MTNASFSLDGKVAVVTGSGQGIGRACAMALGHAGAAVAVTGLAANGRDLDSVCESIRNRGVRAEAFFLDVTDTGSLGSVFDSIASTLGRIDILVNNAGVRRNGPSLTLLEGDWDTVLNVNLKGTFFCSQAAAKHMQVNGGGRIINIAS